MSENLAKYEAEIAASDKKPKSTKEKRAQRLAKKNKGSTFQMEG